MSETEDNGKTSASSALVESKPGTVLAFDPANVNDMWRLAQMLSKSSLIPTTLQGSPEDTLVVMLTGRELGLSAMQSLRGIDVIEGKGQVNAQTMLAMCLRRTDVCEYFSLVESTAERAVYETKRKNCKPVTMEFTFEEAKAIVFRRWNKFEKKWDEKRLVDKDNWRHHRKPMLRWRCVASVARAVYPDIVGGFYTEDEVDEIRSAEYEEIPFSERLDRRRQEAADAASDPIPDADVVDAEIVQDDPDPDPPQDPPEDPKPVSASERAQALAKLKRLIRERAKVQSEDPAAMESFTAEQNGVKKLADLPMDVLEAEIAALEE